MHIFKIAGLQRALAKSINVSLCFRSESDTVTI